MHIGHNSENEVPRDFGVTQKSLTSPIHTSLFIVMEYLIGT